MKHRVPTVTIAVSALNEARNIRAWLSSVERQAQDGFVIEKIIVISDGSTDGTADIARKSSLSAIVEIREYGERRGKGVRMNEVHKQLESDILISSDADVVLAGPYAIRDLLEPFADVRVGLVGGNLESLPGRTFTERAIFCAFWAHQPLRYALRGGNNIFSVAGALLAYRRDVARKVRFPESATGLDNYLYFACVTNGSRYRYADAAKAYYRSPATLRDHLRQSVRYAANRIKMERYFPPDIVRREYAIPFWTGMRYKLRQSLRHPIYAAYMFFTHRYTAAIARRAEHRTTALWDVAESTKHVLSSTSHE